MVQQHGRASESNMARKIWWKSAAKAIINHSSERRRSLLTGEKESFDHGDNVMIC
jgi:hypothetical protein